MYRKKDGRDGEVQKTDDYASMPYWKLALRNVKRQMRSYLIYFMTVAFTVAFLFAMNNIIYGNELQEKAKSSENLASLLQGLTVFISFVVAFVLSYATSFMLKLRKREFGTYLTLGMTRRDILKIFLGETVLICMAALGAGIFLGLFVYQFFMAVMMKLLDVTFTFSAYSMQGLAGTVALVAGLFLVSAAGSAVYLKRVRIYSLLHGEKKVERTVRHPFFWALLTLLFLAGLLYSGFQFYEGMRCAMETASSDLSGVVGCIGIFAISLVMFHIAFARGGISFLQRSRRFAARGTNTFVLRQLSASLGSNSVMLGLLASLLAFAVVGANLSFIQKGTEEEALRRDFPYDILYTGQLEGDSFVQHGEGPSIEEAEQLIRKYVDVREKHSYTLYTDGKQNFYRYVDWAAGTSLHDSYMTVSDFNAYVTPLGCEPIELDHEFFVLANDVSWKQMDWSKIELVLNGETYRWTQAPQQKYRIFNYLLCVVVVPDEAVRAMTAEQEIVSYELEPDTFDRSAIDAAEQALTYQVYTEYMGERFEEPRCDYFFRESSKQERNEQIAVFVVGALYLAAVFLLMAMAILALKTLSQIGEDRKRYQILMRLGAGRREQSRALFWQTFTFFLVPFLIPVILCIPTALIGARLLDLCDMGNLTGMLYTVAGSIAGVMTIVYVLYYLATYLIAKREVIG